MPKTNPAKSDRKGLSDLVVDQLVMGTKEEMEHTDNILAAMKIAVDHLVEDQQYYEKLAGAGLVSAAARQELRGIE